MKQEKIEIIDAVNLSKKQMSELRQRIEEYYPALDYSEPLQVKLDKKNKWFCAVNEKGKVIGFVKMAIDDKKKIITSHDRYVMPEYQRKGIGRLMLVRQIALARGLGRYSIRIDWLNSRTSLPMMQKLGIILKQHAEKRKGKGRIKAGLETHKLTKKEKQWAIDAYTGGKGSFKEAWKISNEKFKRKAVFRKGHKASTADAWIQLMPRTQKGKPAGPKHFGKSLFTPKLPGNKPWRPRRRPL